MNIGTLRPIARTLLRSYEVRSARSADLAQAIMRGSLHLGLMERSFAMKERNLRICSSSSKEVCVS